MELEKTLWTIGIDEAGRGPLAGPVSVGVFAVSTEFAMNKLEGIRDSKQISEEKRNEWYVKFPSFEHCRCAVSFSSPQLIDTEGIVFAIQNALNRALIKLNLEPAVCTVLLDGSLHAPKEYLAQKTIIRGDITEPVISAASILAKVKRDLYMKKVAKEYPDYLFEKHKGYGTKQHFDLLRTYGLSSLHRTSFCKNILQSRE
ncbi:TPA: ribonuclease HII [Patescibacteria group bacterium]|nr:MAG: Ribonuclease HII [Parcubacteria group bacterium GW2011_GWD2_42_14]HCC04944.1 ribonuclease HII [Patescibacteria group bacterium]